MDVNKILADLKKANTHANGNQLNVKQEKTLEAEIKLISTQISSIDGHLKTANSRMHEDSINADANTESELQHAFNAVNLAEAHLEKLRGNPQAYSKVKKELNAKEEEIHNLQEELNIHKANKQVYEFQKNEIYAEMETKLSRLDVIQKGLKAMLEGEPPSDGFFKECAKVGGKVMTTAGGRRYIDNPAQVAEKLQKVAKGLGADCEKLGFELADKINLYFGDTPYTAASTNHNNHMKAVRERSQNGINGIDKSANKIIAKSKEIENAQQHQHQQQQNQGVKTKAPTEQLPEFFGIGDIIPVAGAQPVRAVLGGLAKKILGFEEESPVDAIEESPVDAIEESPVDAILENTLPSQNGAQQKGAEIAAPTLFGALGDPSNMGGAAGGTSRYK